MGLVFTIARAEWRLIVRRRSCFVLLALFAALLGTAAVLSVQRQGRERVQQARYQALVRAQWEDQPDRHPHRVAHYGTFAFKPPGPLAVLDPGVDSYGGRVLYLEAHRQNAANFSEAGELSSAFRLGELSPAFVLHLVLPLIVIVLGHRLWVDERESGRLRLLLGQGVAPRTLAFGKLAALALALLPFLATGALAGGAALAVESAASPPADTALRALVLLVAVTLHVLAWLGLTVWISSRARSAATACGMLVTLWILMAIVAPRAAALVARAVHPLPDKSTFAATVAADVRRHGDSHDPNDPHFTRLREETLARYGVSRVEDLPVNYGAIVMARGEEISAEIFARHFAGLTATMDAQAGIIDKVSLLAPPLAVRTLSARAAGTDLSSQLQFQREAESYRFRFVQQLNELHRDKIRYVNDREQKLGPEHWQEFADFRPVPPTFGASLAGSGLAWAALLGWAALPLVALFRTKGRVA
jgi:ABC-2 type transport system permease protein